MFNQFNYKAFAAIILVKVVIQMDVNNVRQIIIELNLIISVILPAYANRDFNKLIKEYNDIITVNISDIKLFKTKIESFKLKYNEFYVEHFNDDIFIVVSAFLAFFFMPTIT